MLYYYEKRNIDTVDTLVESNMVVSQHTSSKDESVSGNNTFSGTKYKIVDESRNGKYHSQTTAALKRSNSYLIRRYVYKYGINYLLVHNAANFSQTEYKVSDITDVYDTRQVSGSIYKATVAPGSLVSEFISEEGMYPDDGIQGDYWYVKKSRAINFKYKDINGIVYDIAEAKYKDVNGNIVDIASAIYKDSDGNILS